MFSRKVNFKLDLMILIPLEEEEEFRLLFVSYKIIKRSTTVSAAIMEL